jgi:hypothetical protein
MKKFLTSAGLLIQTFLLIETSAFFLLSRNLFGKEIAGYRAEFASTPYLTIFAPQ